MITQTKSRNECTIIRIENKLKSMDISNNNYTETLVFFHVISNYSLTEKYKSTYFSNKTLQTLFDLVRPHIMQYREEPTEEQVLMIAQRENVLTSTTTQDVIHSLWQDRKSVV